MLLPKLPATWRPCSGFGVRPIRSSVDANIIILIALIIISHSFLSELYLIDKEQAEGQKKGRSADFDVKITVQNFDRAQIGRLSVIF